MLPSNVKPRQSWKETFPFPERCASRVLSDPNPVTQRTCRAVLASRATLLVFMVLPQCWMCVLFTSCIANCWEHLITFIINEQRFRPSWISISEFLRCRLYSFCTPELPLGSLQKCLARLGSSEAHRVL